MEINEMTIEEVEARATAIQQEMTEENADLDALVAEARSLEERKTAIMNAEAERRALAEKVADEKVGETIEKFEGEVRKMTNAEIRNSDEYINAYANYVKTGDPTECRTLLTDNASGVVPVPDFVAGIVSEQLKASPILSRTRKMYAKGNVKVGFEISAPAAVAHEEGGDPIDEEELALGIATLIPVTYKKFVQISDEALDSMSGEAYLRYIYDEVTRGIIKAEENAVVAAILAAPQTATATAPAVAKTGSAAGAITDIVDARALLSAAASDLVIILTPALYATYKGLQMAANYGVDPFDGLPVLFNDTVTAPIVGDLNGVLINRPNGDNVEFKYDDKTLMTEDVVKILGRQPAAIGIVGNLFFAKVAA